MARLTLAQAAAVLGRRLDELGRISDEPGALTRTFLSPAMRRANATVGRWMASAGLSVREDGAGNLIGRSGPPGARTLILGSHLDTVRDAGRFDGALGVLLAIAALDVLRSQGKELAFAVEVVGFAEEEGVRFSSAYLGSKAYAGKLRPADLKLRDADGISVGEALAAFGGGPGGAPRAAHRRSELIGYVEAHIEQGPVLESRSIATGVVSAIAGQTRARISFTGKAGHAGATPMALRRDALAGAAQFIVDTEAHARARPPLVATVGRISAQPGASNVIAGTADLSLDLRHPDNAKRRSALRFLLNRGKRIARSRGLVFSAEVTQDNDAVQCSAELTSVLGASVRSLQGSCASLPSGAGHDGVVISSIAPIAMLFVRCRGGLSHHPDEFVSPADLRAALEVLVDFLGRLGPRLSS